MEEQNTTVVSFKIRKETQLTFRKKYGRLAGVFMRRCFIKAINDEEWFKDIIFDEKLQDPLQNIRNRRRKRLGTGD